MASIKVFPDMLKQARAAAEFFVTVAKNAIEERERFSVALSGGRTPESFYSLLSTETYSARIPWDKVHVFWSDERSVPPDNLESNYRLAYMTLLEHVPIPPENIHRIQGELKPDEAAANYEAELRRFFGPDELPRFDLVFLGMGADGHTASLFPYSTALETQQAWVVATFVDDLRAWRITLTPPAINAAANVVFLVRGAEKAERIKEVLEGERDPDRLPAQRILPTHGRLVWLLDQEASALLDR